MSDDENKRFLRQQATANLLFKFGSNIPNMMKNIPSYAPSMPKMNPFMINPETAIPSMLMPYGLNTLYNMSQFAPPTKRTDAWSDNNFNGSWK